jgi:hypothetical protein
MEFYFPTEFGEQMAFVAAAVSAIIGLFVMFAPGVTSRLFEAGPKVARSVTYVLIRSYGGMQFGLGVGSLIIAQDWAYFALGLSFAFSSLAILLSILFDGGVITTKSLLLVVHSVLAALPLMYVFGLF